METTALHVNNIHLFKQNAFAWANQFDTVCYLDSNNYTQFPYLEYDFLLAVDALSSVTASVPEALDSLQSFLNVQPEWAFGFFSYDVKNELENLQSTNPDQLEFPDLFFFSPRYLIYGKNGKVHINRNYPEAYEIVETIQKYSYPTNPIRPIDFTPCIGKKEYCQTVDAIRTHIEEGDIYELNLCQAFYAHEEIDPIDVFLALNARSKMPFSAYVKRGDQYSLCASPERFLKKTGRKIVSQPIKGTIRKGRNPQEDDMLKKQLKSDPKEQAENVMIVDLVRNDLTKYSVPGSVRVEELYGIYGFEHVNQMISTVSASVRENVSSIDIIKQAFPMGSMTGAPKIKTMELIDQYEQSKRGLYSGSIGFFTPESDFDFNVVIRTLLYDATKKHLSFQVGGAITYDSVPEKEYEESLLKAKAIFEIFSKKE